MQPKKQQQARQKISQKKNAADALIRACLLTVLFSVPVVFSPWYRGGHELFFPIKMLFTQVPLIAALAFFLFRSASENEIKWQRSSVNMPVLAVLAAAALSLAGSVNALITLGDIYRIFFYVLFYFLFINFVKTKKDMNAVLVWALLAFTAVNFYGVLQRFRIDLLAPAGGRTGVDSTLGNPDFYGCYLVSLIPLSLACIFIVRREWRAIIGILTVAGMAFLFMTGSRAGFLGFLVSMLLLVILILISPDFKREAKVWIISIAGAALVLMIALSFVGGTTFSRIRESANLKSTNIRFRILCYESTLNIMKEHFLTGTGSGTFYNVYPKYRVPGMKEVFTFVETPRYTHNDYLQVGSETGIIGLAALAWLIFAFFRQGIRVLKETKDLYWRWLATGAVCSFSGMLVTMVFDFPFYRPETTLSFWLMPSLLSAIAGRKGDNENVSVLRVPGWAKPALIAALAAGIPLMIFASVNPFIGNMHYNKGLRLERSYQRTQDPDQKKQYVSLALKEYKKAVSEDRQNDMYHTKIGTFYGDLSRELWISEQEKKEYMLGAVSNFDEALRLCPNYAGSHYNSGQSYLFYGLAYDKSYIERSEKRLKDAIALSSFSEAELFHNQLGLLYKEQGMLDKAIQEYEEALKINPKTIQSLVNLGNAYYARGQYDRSIEIYNRALAVGPGSSDALNNLANAYYQKRMFAQAIENYKKVIATNPGYIDAYNNLGSVYFVARMYPEAKTEFQKVIQLVPAGSPQANYAGSMLSRIP